MKDFKELDKRSVHEVEESILNEWKKQDILNKCIDSRKESGLPLRRESIHITNRKEYLLPALR